MNPLHCPSEERLLRYVDQDLSTQDAQALRLHLGQCAACHAQVDALSALLSELRSPALADFDPRQHARAVLLRLPKQAQTPAAHRGRTTRVLSWGAALACAATVLVVSRSAFAPPDTWQARGGARAGSIARDVGLQLYEAEPSWHALTPGATIRPNAPLTAGYRNLGSQPAYLLLFAIDDADSIHWIAPPYTDVATDPSAAVLPPNHEEQLLPHTVQLEQLSAGELRVLTVITRSPSHVSSIEALQHSGVSAHSITAALPEAEVRELRLQVNEAQP
jgi:hypothetical protein